MNKQQSLQHQGRVRSQRLRDSRKAQGLATITLSISKIEQQKLDSICRFFSYPAEPYGRNEAILAVIKRVYDEIPKITNRLGCCGKCGDELPQGCAKYAVGGLFKGDATCWHTLNKIRITSEKAEAK